MAFILAILASLGLVAWAGANRALHPARRKEQYAPEDFGLAVEEVKFASRDGTSLAGWFVPGEKRMALALLHGYGRSRAELLPQAGILHRAGYSVLLFDFRHSGESAGDRVTVGIKEPLDVLGAVDYLRGRPEVDPERVGVLGVSLGAAAGILAAAREPGIRCVVSEGAFHSLKSVLARGTRVFIGLPSFPFALLVRLVTEWRLGSSVDDVTPGKVIGRISPRAVLIIQGLEDDNIAYRSAQVLYWQAREPKELWLVPGAPHARACGHDQEEYRRRVLGFLEKHL